MKVTADDIAQLLASRPPRRVPPQVAHAQKRQWGSWKGAGFGLFFGSFGMIFVWIFFPWRFVDEIRLATSGVAATGRVTAVNETSMKVNEERVYEFVFSYAPTDGQATIASCYASGHRWSVGEESVLRYLPANPAVACLDGGRLDQAGLWAAFVIIFPLIGYGIVAATVWARFASPDLLRDGLMAEVDVLSVAATTLKVNRQTVYRITLSSPTGFGGPLTLRRLDPAEIAVAQKRHETKQPVFVLYRANKPKQLMFPEALIGE